MGSWVNANKTLSEKMEEQRRKDEEVHELRIARLLYGVLYSLICGIVVYVGSTLLYPYFH